MLQVLSHLGAAPFHPVFRAQELDFVYNQAVNIGKFAVHIFPLHKIQQECVKILRLFL